MARPIRVEYPGATYHIMSRGVARLTTFVDDVDRREFVRHVGHSVTRGVFQVHAFCLMPNHYHLLASTPVGGLGRVMHRTLGLYAIGFNQRHGRVGHLWQARYKAILVEEGEYFLDCSRYVHLNPVKAALVREPRSYGWSSYRNFLGCASVAEWVETEKTLGYFDSPVQYIEFVESAADLELTSPFRRATAGLVFGGETFLDQVRNRIEAQPDRNPIDFLGLRRLKETEPGPTVGQVRSAVAHFFPDLSPCQQRRILAFALHQLTWMKRVEIARVVARTPQAVSAINRTLGRRLREDADLAGRLRRLFRYFSERTQ